VGGDASGGGPGIARSVERLHPFGKWRVLSSYYWGKSLAETGMIVWPAFQKFPIHYDASHIDGMAYSHPSSIRKTSPYSVKLLESYCVACGLLIAASSRRRILSEMKRLHICPKSFNRLCSFGQTRRAAVCENPKRNHSPQMMRETREVSDVQPFQT
jgi:hypothetical protein